MIRDPIRKWPTPLYKGKHQIPREGLIYWRDPLPEWPAWGEPVFDGTLARLRQVP